MKPREGLFFGMNLIHLFSKTIMIIAHVKDFSAFLSGDEVKAVVSVKAHENMRAGEHVLAVKDSIASDISVPVPHGKMHESMGIEATVVSTQGTSADNAHTIVIRKD